LIPPRISIVTPSYNQGEFLEECIDSMLSQNYQNLEYIIMDGGSTDNSVEIIKKYEKYLTYWQNNHDNGQYDAIAQGFKKSTGEIMAWLNAYDKYHHHAFFKVAFIFFTHQEIEWLTGRHSQWDKDGHISFVLTEYLPVFSRRKYLKKDYMFPPIQQESTFWRRPLWERAGSRMRTDLAFVSDLELWIRFFRYTQLYTVDTVLGGFRLHEEQKSFLHMDRYIDESERLLDEEISLTKKGVYPDDRPAPQPLALDFSAL
jgi:glycosyltransferase involved in cell wall biosynthesis